MATVLKRYRELEELTRNRIEQGAASPDQVWGYSEVVYRISVLETCKMLCKSAPMTLEMKALLGHYQMVDAYVQNLAQERRYGPDRGPDTKKERDAAQNNLSRVITDYRKRFSSFKPSASESYAQEITRAVNTLIPAWLQFRNTFVPFNKKEAPTS